MRVALVAFIVAFAGCIGAVENAPSGATPDDVEGDGERGHPAYPGYGSNDDLPEEDEPEPEPEQPMPPADNHTVEAPPPVENETQQPAPASKWRKPAYRPLPDTIESLTALGHASGTTNAAGFAVFGPLAFIGGTGGPMHVVDIAIPEQARTLATFDVPARDIGTILYPDDRLIVVSTGGSKQLFFSDVSDPENPVVVGVVTTPHTNHNLVVVPGTPIVYNAPSGGAYTDIIDASDPENPVVIKEWGNGAGCHDVTFHFDREVELYRGYCAGIDEVQIWDLWDPAEPKVITSFNWPGAGIHDSTSVPLVTFAHLAIVNHDASVLILGDETLGGAGPGCDAYAHVAGQTVSGPLGNLYFYDITDEKNPDIRGHMSVSATDATTSCTAHFGQVIEDRDALVMAFYTAGVILVNFTDLDNPRILDAWKSGRTWDAQFYQGYVFAGTMNRGLDVLALA